jgi:hypothetical protein
MSHADTYDDEAAIASDVRDTLKRGTITRAAWLEHRGLLAEGLGDDEWETLGVAYLLIALVDQYHDADKSDLVEVVREGGAEDGPIADAISALTPHAYPTAGALAGRRRG